MKQQKTFSSFEICKGLEINRPTLQDWLSRGFVKPAIEAKGRGTKNVFSIDNLYQIELFRQLVARGFNRMECSQWIQYLSLEGIREFHMHPEMYSKAFPNIDFYKQDEFSHTPFLMITRRGSEYNRSLTSFNQLMEDRGEDLKGVDEIHLINLNSVIEKVEKAFF